MKCELLEGLSSLCVSLLFCMVLVLPAAIGGAEKGNIADSEKPTEEVEVQCNVERGKTEVDAAREAFPLNNDRAPAP